MVVAGPAWAITQVGTTLGTAKLAREKIRAEISKLNAETLKILHDMSKTEVAEADVNRVVDQALESVNSLMTSLPALNEDFDLNFWRQSVFSWTG